MSGPSPRPLAGIRVVDFSSMIAGPYCSRLLADCGAEVLKIEERTGDHMRTGRPLRDGHSAYFGHLNCGKKSLAVDLKDRRAARSQPTSWRRAMSCWRITGLA